MNEREAATCRCTLAYPQGRHRYVNIYTGHTHTHIHTHILYTHTRACVWHAHADTRKDATAAEFAGILDIKGVADRRGVIQSLYLGFKV